MFAEEILSFSDFKHCFLFVFAHMVHQAGSMTNEKSINHEDKEDVPVKWQNQRSSVKLGG